ncbi:MAG: helix-turn-helix domain-containing protein [Mycobacterium sp.]
MSTNTPGRSNKLQASTGLPALLTISQVADAYGLSTKTIRRRVSDGTFLAHRIGPRCIRIERDSRRPGSRFRRQLLCKFR